VIVYLLKFCGVFSYLEFLSCFWIKFFISNCASSLVGLGIFRFGEVIFIVDSELATYLYAIGSCDPGLTSSNAKFDIFESITISPGFNSLPAY
jgi:hypothetical protein